MNQYFLNPKARPSQSHRGLFGDEDYKQVRESFRIPPTPLLLLPGLASKIGIRDILLKDESGRMESNSFKILGVSFVVHHMLSEGHLTQDSVLVCASEGNHGRAVARAARHNGLAAIIYLPADTAIARREAITGEGAQVIMVDGNYDDAVRLVAEDAVSNGWTILSDTSWPGYEGIPSKIMVGYTQLLDEAEAQWSPGPPPDVVLVQAGVGSLACAVVSWLCHRYGAARPFTIVCEPTAAACLQESARSGKPVSLRGPFQTIMAGLRCGDVSPLAWPTISAAVDAFVSIGDEECGQAMRTLACPSKGDPKVVAGASGACGLASLVAILHDERLKPMREVGGFSTRSRVLVINTEGATDPELYSRVIGEAATRALARRSLGR